MTAMVKSDMVAAHPNVHDGTVLISEYDNEALDGACITILGRADVEADELPTIVAFSLDDLAFLADLHAEIVALKGGM